MLSRSSNNLLRRGAKRWLLQSRIIGVTATTPPPRFCSFAATEESLPDEDEIDDSFEILGLPRKFKVSPNDLKQSYRALMTKYHPDKHSGSTNVNNNNEDIEAMASRITNAFQVLKEPHTRATHLLELVGSPVDETSQTDLVGMEFLMEVMELREDVESTDPKYLKPIWEETKVRIASIVDELDEAFESQNYSKAMELASQLQY